MNTTRYDRFKRILDVGISSAGLLLTAPVQLTIAGLIRAKLGRPILFRQHRPGRDGALFELLKFRTMREPDPTTDANSDEDRITPFGAFLRSTSLDELPSLWNILKGEMSLVGPRPLLEEYLPLYTPGQATRHDIRPGLTGLAQVSGRNNLDWESRLDLDAQYVQSRSLRIDIAILAKTVTAVLSRRDVSAHGRATVGKFEGLSQDRLLDSQQ